MIPKLSITFSTDIQPALLVRVFEKGSAPDGMSEALLTDASREPVVTYVDGQRTAVIVIGEGPDSIEAARATGGRAATLASRLKVADFALDLRHLDSRLAAALAEGALLGSYRFDDYLTSRDEPRVGEIVALLADAEDADDLHRVAKLSRATAVARDLVNRSPHEKSAPKLADSVRALCRQYGLRYEVMNKSAIEAERMGGLLAVNRGSVDPPRFVIMEHAPASAEGQPPVVLVGKAVVFDTGGLSLKPTKDSMDQMKADMAGAAAVIGAMLAIAEFDLPLHVVALIPMTDNRPGGDAYVPGDVVKMRNGLTVEVLNTDAEGRMLLADALDYAKEYQPQLVIDVATLTGSAVIALGTHVAAVMTNEDDGHDARLRDFVKAGRKTGEWVHPLPTFDHYADQLKSDVADLKNLGGREAGTITAAKFLQRFTHDREGNAAYPWVHVDIAGPAFISSSRPYRPVGGTGFGVRLLAEVMHQIAGQD